MQSKEQELLDKLVARYLNPSHKITTEHLVTALGFLKESPRRVQSSQQK